jgi:hypothetical protein
MRVKLRMMVDDARFAPLGRPQADEGVVVDRDWTFGDGPSCDRIVVVDCDFTASQAFPGATFAGPDKRRKLGRYPEAEDRSSRAFNQVSVFATVIKTLAMFEEADALGRELTWAFASPQLILYPRGREEENAHYLRHRGCLEFGYFPSRVDPHETVCMSLARDVVAHETGHAILDGIAPDLLYARSSQAQALHEAVADLSALLISIRSQKLSRAVLAKTAGSIARSTHFSAIGEQYGAERGTGALRDLANNLTLSAAGKSAHALSQVLTGALYAVLMQMHAARRSQRALSRGCTEYAASGYALHTAAQHFKRLTLRGLDYLPPGEVSFADYGRAMLAPDLAAHPDDGQERGWLVEEFVRRGIAANAGELDPALPARARIDEILAACDRAALAHDREAALEFVSADPVRSLLQIPAGVTPRVQPPLVVARSYYHRLDEAAICTKEAREVILKVGWDQPSADGSGAIPVGSVLAWDADTGCVRALLVSDQVRKS